MVSPKSLPITGKVLMVIALFAVLAIASAVYAIGAMRGIDTNYHAALAQRGKAALRLAEADHVLDGAIAAIGEWRASGQDAGRQQAAAVLNAARDAFAAALAAAAAADPAVAPVAMDFARRGRDLIDRACADHLWLGAAPRDALQACGRGFAELANALAAAVRQAATDLDSEAAALSAATDSAIVWSAVILLGGLAVVTLFGVLAMAAMVSRPIERLAGAMQRIAAGHLADAVPGVGRGDEIGRMARAVQVFRDNGRKLVEAEAEASRLREAAERHRAETEAARLAAQARPQDMTKSLTEGLDRHSNDDRTGGIAAPAPPANVHRLVPAQANPVHAIRAKLAAFAGTPGLVGKTRGDRPIQPGEREEF